MFIEQATPKHISPVRGDMFFCTAHAAPSGAHDISLCLIYKHNAPKGGQTTKRRDHLIPRPPF